MSNYPSTAGYRLRMIQGAAPGTAVMVIAVLMYVAVGTPEHVPLMPMASVLGISVAVALATLRIDWSQMLASGQRSRWLYAWMGLNIGMICTAIAITGGAESELYVLFVLTTLFSAAMLPIRPQAILLVLSISAYVATLGISGSDINGGVMVLRVAALLVVGFFSAILSHDLWNALEREVTADRKAIERARLLSIVAGAAQSMSSVDPVTVLDRVARAAVELGFDAANIGVFENGRYRIAHQNGLPERYAKTDHDPSAGAHGQVLRKKETVVIGSYRDDPRGMSALQEAGMDLVVSSPIYIEGKLAAALSVSSLTKTEVSPEDIEAIELLAGQAGRALEIANRFEKDHAMLQKLAEADQIKTDFVSNVSHELRTPLTVVEGMATTLLTRWDKLDDELKLSLLGRLQENAVSLQEVISRLLDFSRIESGVLELCTDLLDIGQVARSVAVRINDAFPQVRLSSAIDEGLVVKADRTLMERVIENLLTNAIKHNPEGTNISLSVRSSIAGAIVEVVDDGVGIPAHEIGRLGERFFRGGHPHRRPTRGLGLGLALSKEILELHGSGLDIRSREGQGSSFGFELPVALRTNYADQQVSISDELAESSSISQPEE